MSLHFLVNIGGAGYHPAAWLDPALKADAFIDLEHYVRAATIAERGLLDGLLFPDIPVQQPGIARAPTATLDPTLLTSALAGSTSHIGLIPTASTSLNKPYNLARRILTLDHVSGGRAGWNAVTTFEHRAGRNFGIDELPDRDERYGRAAEFVDVTVGLWDSWEDDALVGDQSEAHFADPQKVHALQHQGEFYSVAGPLNVIRSPQGRPVLVQAGSSPQGIEFAARHAEVIYGTQFGLEGAASFSDAVGRGALAAGRQRSDVKILPGLVPLVGSTEAEAREKFDELQARLHPDHDAFTSFARWLGFEPDDLDIDAPLAERHLRLPADRNGPQGFFHTLTRYASTTGATVRELLSQFLGGHRVVTGTPESIADHIETWSRSGDVDGFTIVPAVLPTSLEDFVDDVVPVLQRRGLFRTEYASNTLRGNLGLAEPANTFVNR
ncbi:LLM class flavin-dependent oxidoreductase [Rhodococcoides kyotonense]|uniref:FMN-dependent oxidoreductase, nitrilotriacetate monooxygenase family n=1 Tax=Rhodococcoides kyotonense TaxID=398843 RepID=A0A239GBZ7_9NOCA|nr:LLM class flavin-dependent oxidoreductase [Rhodococcus kyotonensis]SNS66455.1 FMN-dependent oxidoreductase, nitrilotriacetate monooxygenase family [Rhodococcus kyotonensis]